MNSLQYCASNKTLFTILYQITLHNSSDYAWEPAIYHVKNKDFWGQWSTVALYKKRLYFYAFAKFCG